MSETARPGLLQAGEVVVKVTVDMRRFMRAMRRLHANLPRYRKENAIQARNLRRAEVQANRRQPLIHNGGKP